MANAADLLPKGRARRADVEEWVKPRDLVSEQGPFSILDTWIFEGSDMSGDVQTKVAFALRYPDDTTVKGVSLTLNEDRQAVHVAIDEALSRGETCDGFVLENIKLRSGNSYYRLAAYESASTDAAAIPF